MQPASFRLVHRTAQIALLLVAGAMALLCHDAWAAPAYPFLMQAQFRQQDGLRGGGAGHGARRAEMREQRAQAGAQRAQRQAQREQAQQQRGQQQELREAPQQAAPMPPEQPAEGRPGRLTLEERRALRQQINDAGREIYRPRRP